MVEVKELKKEFIKQDKHNNKTKFYAVNGMTLSCQEGEIIGILGANGAGKTTFLRMLAGIMQPTSGTIEIDGQNYKENEIEIKRKIAFLSGNTRLYNRLNSNELLDMCGRLYNLSNEKIQERKKDIFKILEMEDFKNNKIGNLSTGQTQRVGIARCLIHNPKYYILDEATTGLDVIASQIILNFIKEEKKNGKTIFYSTHYMEEAENICDRVFMINQGVIIEQGTPAEIREKTKTTNLRDAFFNLIGGVAND